MIDLQNMDHMPDIGEIDAYIGNSLFKQFYEYILTEYKDLCKIEYSKDTWARGWNIKFRKAGKSLCVIYPKEKYFTVLVVIGRKEREDAEELLPEFSDEMQSIYHKTKEGNGQRWLMIDLKSKDRLYQDTLRLIRIRRESR